MDFLVFAIVAILQIFFVKAGIFISVALNRAFPMLPVDACYFAIPFACGAMIIAVLINRNVAMIMSILTSFLISLLFDEKVIFPLFSFLGSAAASYHIVNSRQRSTFLKVGLFLGVINVLAILCLNLLTGQLLADLASRLAMGFLGGVITGIMVAGIAPLFESLFGYITDIKLLELANLNQPLFQRMIIEAPGTYHTASSSLRLSRPQPKPSAPIRSSPRSAPITTTSANWPNRIIISKTSPATTTATTSSRRR